MRTLLDRKQQFPGNSGLFRSANISGSWNTTCFRGSNLFGESVLYEFVFLSTFSSIIADYPKPLTLRTSCRKTPGEIPNGTLPMCCSHHFTGCFLKSCTSRDDRLMSHVYVLFNLIGAGLDCHQKYRKKMSIDLGELEYVRCLLRRCLAR